jgi:hypothetical protein
MAADIIGSGYSRLNEMQPFSVHSQGKVSSRKKFCWVMFQQSTFNDIFSYGFGWRILLPHQRNVLAYAILPGGLQNAFNAT